MLNESAEYESKQILDQRTQPCFHVILHVDFCIKSNSAAGTSKLHYLSLLSLPLHPPPPNLPASYLTKLFKTHSKLQLNNFTRCLRRLISLFKKLFPRHWFHFFQNIVSPSISDHFLWRTVFSAPLTSGMATWLSDSLWLVKSEWKWCEQRLQEP